MAEHTKLPWHINQHDRVEISDESNESVCSAEPMYGDSVSEKVGECEANAEFIVRAVNAHQALVDALERYGGHYISCGSIRPEESARGMACTCGFAEALALARGESADPKAVKP